MKPINFYESYSVKKMILRRLNMNNEVLDDFDRNEISNKGPVSIIALLSTASVLIFLLLEKTRDKIPENIIEWEGVEIKTGGLVVVGVILLNALLIPTYLDRWTPKLSKIKIVVYTGLIIGLVEVVFQLIYQIFLLNTGFDYVQMVTAAIVMSIVGMLIANIRIQRVRNESVLIPILLLAVIWIGFGLVWKG